MATLPGSQFEEVLREHSELNNDEIVKAVSLVGAHVTFHNVFGPDGVDRHGHHDDDDDHHHHHGRGHDNHTLLVGTSQNDLYFVDNKHTRIEDSGGTDDLVVSSVDYELPEDVEHLVLTGDDNLDAEGNDRDNFIAGNDGDNKIEGEDGDDIIFGGRGDDRIKGGDGDDTICGGDGEDKIKGGDGDDFLDGGTGKDTIEGGDGHDTIYGGGEFDKIEGGDGNDYIDAQAGNDTVDGGDGNDTIYGGTGTDDIEGDDGKDELFGGDGTDYLRGNDGNDTLYGDAGNDHLYGGSGSDSFVFSDASGQDQVHDFTIGKDKLLIEANLNGSGINSAADILTSHLSSNSAGDAVVDLGGGNSITLVNVDMDDLKASSIIII